MPVEEENPYEIDHESWNERQQDRDLYEVVREPIQNSMDTGSDIHIQINYDDNSIVVEDYDEDGVTDLSDFYTIFQGSKSGDPTSRGRFGRGLKELVGASETAVAHSTGGAVKWNSEADKPARVKYEEPERDVGTVVYASNSSWTEQDLDLTKGFIESIIPEEEMSIQIEDDRGYQNTVEYEEPDSAYQTILETASGEERVTKVELRRSEECGGIYEMGIPVTWDEEFPFELNIQQTVPMAEQRQDLDSEYRSAVLHSLLHKEMDSLEDEELVEGYVTENLLINQKLRSDGEWLGKRLPREVEIEYLERRFEKPQEMLVMSALSQYDDKAEQSGYEVLEPSDFNRNVSALMKKNLRTTKELVRHLNESDKVDKDIEPSEVQQKFLDFVDEEILEPIWDWDRDDSDENKLLKTLGKKTNSRTPIQMGEKPDVDIALRENDGEEVDRWAFYDPIDHTIYFNMAETEDNWEDMYLERGVSDELSDSYIEDFIDSVNIPEGQRIGVAIHEAAHAEADSNEHDKEWYHTMEMMAGTLIEKMMLENEDLEAENESLNSLMETGDIQETVQERTIELHREKERLEKRLETRNDRVEKLEEIAEEELEEKEELQEEVERLEQELEERSSGAGEYVQNKVEDVSSKIRDFF